MSGAFRHQVTLLSGAVIDDDGGGVTLVWTPITEFWANAEYLSSVADFLGDKRRRLKRVALTIRKRLDVVLGGRLIFDGATFEVVSIESDDEQGRRLILICEEVAAL